MLAEAINHLHQFEARFENYIIDILNDPNGHKKKVKYVSNMHKKMS